MEYVIFKLGGENYTIKIDKIKEILVYSQVIITNLFDEEPYMKGLINLRGEVIPIIDLRTLFGIKDSKISSNSVIIVANVSGDKLVGAIVDNIVVVKELDLNQKVQAPPLGVSIDPKYIEGLVRLDVDDMATILNIDTVLQLEELCE